MAPTQLLFLGSNLTRPLVRATVFLRWIQFVGFKMSRAAIKLNLFASPLRLVLAQQIRQLGDIAGATVHGGGKRRGVITTAQTRTATD